MLKNLADSIPMAAVQVLCARRGHTRDLIWRPANQRSGVTVALAVPQGSNVQRFFRNDDYFPWMDEFRARRVVDSLRDRGVNAHLLRGGNSQFGVRVSLPGGREAEWDTDGTAGLEAQVMRDGMLVGYVPRIEGSDEFDESHIVDAIVRTDYDQPVARQRKEAPAAAPALTREGGVFRRFLDGFRYR